MRCKRKSDYYHVGIFIWSLNLIGIILGELTNRFCLIFEEYFHLYTRYNGSIWNMFCACFNDISLRVVLFGTLVAGVVITVTLLSQGTDYFEFEYIEIILSGFGSGSLVVYLLSFDTLSRVQVSSLMENNNRLIANGLAWSYYLGYLKIILPGLHERIEETEWKNKLSSKKVFILVPRECYSYDTISQEDKSIIFCQDRFIEYETDRAGTKRTYRNFVYEIARNDGNSPLRVLAEYPSQLSTLHAMSHSSQAMLSLEDRDEQAKLFLRTLEAILKCPSVPAIRNTCKLVPYARTGRRRLSEVLAQAVLEDIYGSQ